MGRGESPVPCCGFYEDDIFMTLIELNELIEHPFEEKIFSSKYGKFYIEEHDEFNDVFQCVTGKIYCSFDSNPKSAKNGYVEFHFNIGKKCSSFESWETHLSLQRKGIGTHVMLKVIKNTKILKQFYSMDYQINLSGKLSIADKANGNWKMSVSGYEKVGKIAGITYYFVTKDGVKYYTAADFLSNADIDGRICYEI